MMSKKPPDPPDKGKSFDEDVPSPSEFITIPAKRTRMSSEEPVEEPQKETPVEEPVIPARLYTSKDRGPYLVHVTKREATQLYHVDFGKFLHKNGISTAWGGIKSLGRNRLSIEFNKLEEANKFITSDIIKEHYNAFIPTFCITRMGIIRGYPTHWATEDILMDANVSQGAKISKARRLNFKSKTNEGIKWNPSEAVVLTFDGQFLPKSINIYNVFFKVDLYVFPTIQCYKCCRFGHTKTVCRSQPRCFRCGEEHLGEGCGIPESDLRCASCGGRHSAVNRICPEHTRQQNIKRTMAEQNISYVEACKKHSPTMKPFSEVVASRSSIARSDQFVTKASPSKIVSNPTTSYRQTVYKTSTPRTQTQYNKPPDHSHLLWFPNGQLPQSENSPNGSALLKENSIPLLLNLLISIVNETNHIPSYVAKKLIELIAPFSNESSEVYNSVEQP
jgi:hypothetical protein